jgi:RNA polymerase sigma-70 factor (family 1)
MVISSDTFVRFREGEETAFRQLYDDYSPRITYFAGKILKDDPYTEDIVSDIFRKAWENRRKFAGQRHLHNFLYVVTRNDCINYMNTQRIKKTGNKTLAWLLADSADDALPLDLERAQTEVMRVLNEVLETLPSPSREVITMSFFQHKTTREIATELQLTDTNVYTIKSRTLDRLKALLPKDRFVLLLLLIGGL